MGHESCSRRTSGLRRRSSEGFSRRPTAWSLRPHQDNHIEKRVNYHGREEAAAPPPQFAGNATEYDCCGGHNEAALEVANAKEQGREHDSGRHWNAEEQEGSLPPLFEECLEQAPEDDFLLSRRASAKVQAEHPKW